MDSAKSSFGYTNLYRLASQPPYGLTPVQNWPGYKEEKCPAPVPISMASLSDLHVALWAVAPNRVSVIEAAGLTEQFSPALPALSEGQTIKLETGK